MGRIRAVFGSCGAVLRAPCGFPGLLWAPFEPSRVSLAVFAGASRGRLGPSGSRRLPRPSWIPSAVL
eukprot:4025426-Pyramimonas_sp.AAC.1